MIELDHLVGAMGHASSMVTTDNTAVAMGSGALPVYATPAMATLMEQAAITAVQSYLPLGMTTVGTALEVRHLAATPIGHNVQAEAVLLSVSGRKLCFKVAAFDEREKIGEGKHERSIVEAESFMTKMASKRPKQ